MEMIEVPKAKFEKMERELEMLKKESNIDIDLLEQFIDSLKDIKEGRIRRVK